MTFDIRLEHRFNDGGDNVRAVSFRVGSGRWARFLPAVDNRLQLPAQIPREWSPIAEVCATITLSELRKIDDSADLQRKFIRRNLTPKPGTAGVPIMKVLVAEGERIAPSDIDYLGHLLPPADCSITSVPLVYRCAKVMVKNRPRPNESGTPPPNPEGGAKVGDDRAEDPAAAAPGYHWRNKVGKALELAEYVAFAKQFIEVCSASGTKSFALTVPFNVGHRGVPELLATYKDVSVPMAIIDGAGGNLDEARAQIRAIEGAPQTDTYSLRQKAGENYALYAYDTKAYRGRKDVVGAVNLLLLDRGFSGFGRLHTIHLNIPKLEESAPRAPRRVRIAFPKELAYALDSNPEAVSFMAQWWAKRGGKADDMTGELISKHRRSFEQESLAGAAYRIGTWALAGEVSAQLDRRAWIKDDLRRTRQSNRSAE